MSDERSRVALLMDEADKAYDAQDQAWFDALPTDDLTALWGLACATLEGVSYDDEVHDALHRKGWFDREVTPYQ